MIHALLTNMPRILKIAGVRIPRSLIVGCSLDESITGSYFSVFKRKLNEIYLENLLFYLINLPRKAGDNTIEH